MKKQLLLGSVWALCVFALYFVIAGTVPAHQTEETDTAMELLAVSYSSRQDTEDVPVTLETIRAFSFPDLSEDSAGYNAACYAVYYDLLPWTEGQAFAPDAPADRATAAAALYRLSGETASGDGSRYADVPQGSWYADAAAWISGAGIAVGTEEGLFAPQEAVTRSQLAVMLCRFAAYRGNPVDASGDLSAYQDSGKVDPAAAQAVSWALERGLYRMLVTDTIYPDLPVSRIQLSEILVALQDGTDGLAGEIQDLMPGKTADSAARRNHDSIQAAVDSAAKKYGAVGVQVAVVENGQVSDTYAYGWATKGTDPMTAGHKIRVASISKVAVGLTAMILREDGVIDLDAGIGDYWGCTVRNPRYPDTPITIRSILTHTSSIFTPGEDESWSHDSAKSRLQGSGYSNAAPGALSSWSYNNYAFGVLGMTLELASGRYANDILAQRLFGPMEIDSAFGTGDLQDASHLATLYQGGSVTRSVAAQKSLKRWSYPGATGAYFPGGLMASSTDLAKIVALLSQDGRYEGVRILDAESVELMESHASETVPGGFYQGMPLRYQTELYGRDGLYYHTGSAYGVYNCISYDPDSGDGVVVLTVGASGAKDDRGIYAICGEISRCVYDTIQ